MVVQKPLIHPCMAYMLLYLDPNVRFNLVTRSETFRTHIHPVVPLLINRLTIKETSFTLNNTEHTFKTILENPTGEELLFKVNQNNLNGGINYDVDEYGNKERQSYLEPGDFQVGELPIEEKPLDIMEQHKRENEDRIKNGLLPIRIIQEDKINNDDDDQPEIKKARISFPDHIVRPTPILLRPKPVQTVMRPKYETHVLYIFKPLVTGTLRIIRIPKGLKIRDSMRQVLGLLLDCHNAPVIKNLDIMMEQGVIRISKVPRVHVQNLSLSSNALESIHTALSPLGQSPAKINFNNLSVKLSENYLRHKSPIGQYLPRLSTRSVTLSSLELCPNDLFNLIQNWIDTPRALWTKFSARCANVIPMIQVIRRRVRVALGVMNFVVDPDMNQCGTYQLSEHCQLNIYGTKVPNYEEELAKPNGLPFTLVMQVMPVGTARAVN
ncbi:hypothetical protein CAEBREN_04337 [Caenorhabditis brenneri]|uniref:Uncharacterized protein n=1 Tax=Caenorhabditis brenneri TaxID=135651 RepID=G0MDR8_CAEBE|nr:hypothetical protein CAEBREN_04337 [Caenorhabditis brenneri]